MKPEPQAVKYKFPEFRLAFREYCDEEGMGCDGFDVQWNWGEFQKDASKYRHLTERLSKIRSELEAP